MIRKLFTMLALFSLLLCVGTAWWWTSSGDRIDQVTYERHGVQTVNLSGSGGKVMFSRTVYDGDASDNLRLLSFNSLPLDAKADISAANASMMVSFAKEQVSGGTMSKLVIPTWLIVAVLSLMPGLWFVLRMNRRRKAKEALNG
jgi:hypothetical protein